MDKEIIKNRVQNLRKKMEEYNIDAYIIPTDDYHSSEYVGDYFKQRAFITGFNGSAGTALVTKDAAILWTDGRYFLQAESDLEGTPFVLYKMGEAGVPDLYKYLNVQTNIKNIGFDGRCFTNRAVSTLKTTIKNREINIIDNYDLIGEIWPDRPKMSCSEAFELDIKFSGKSRLEKIEDVKREIEKKNANGYVISSLDDIAWLLNLRGNDVECNPVILSYVLFVENKLYFYVQKNALTKEVKASLETDHIIIKEYNDIYEDVKHLNASSNILINEGRINYSLYNNIPSNKISLEIDITTIKKAIKNETEIVGAINAHIRDGVALTNFIYDMKHYTPSSLTELGASALLEGYRAKGEYYKGLSFDTIAGWKDHGAIIHYEPTKETDVTITNNGFLLVDSGAQYLDGTTDVTRTISIGNVTEEEKERYTLVLKGHLALGDAYFREGWTGAQLDYLARNPLWRYGLDYNHGTGHGVGSFLNVHEGPQNISGNVRYCSYPFYPGMITSNEPGYYKDSEYGIRIENLILCKRVSDDSKYLHFETLTLAPYDVEAIKKEMLTVEEVKLIHDYHKRVYDTLKPYLDSHVLKWLEEIVNAI